MFLIAISTCFYSNNCSWVELEGQQLTSFSLRGSDFTSPFLGDCKLHTTSFPSCFFIPALSLPCFLLAVPLPASFPRVTLCRSFPFLGLQGPDLYNEGTALDDCELPSGPEIPWRPCSLFLPYFLQCPITQKLYSQWVGSLGVSSLQRCLQKYTFEHNVIASLIHSGQSPLK